MTQETEITTPVDVQEEVTSETVEPENNSVTSTEEPSNEEVTAVIENESTTTEEPKLYAGKYKTIEEFEKGHNELYGAFNKAKEYQNKYNQLLEQQEQEAQRIAQEKLAQARQYGFRSAEEQEIDRQVKLQEYQYFAQNLNQITDVEQYQEVSNLLSNYFSTGHTAYLDAAKEYFPIRFIEQVNKATTNFENRLVNDFRQRMQQEHTARQEKIDNSLKQEFAEFLADTQANPAKDLMFKALRSTGVLNNVDDMKVFVDYYSQMAKYEREQAIKEFQAQKIIEETKNKAQIISDGFGTVQNDTPPTLDQINKMSQDQYNAAVDKWGLEKIITAK